jgi:hypothetical protein
LKRQRELFDKLQEMIIETGEEEREGDLVLVHSIQDVELMLVEGLTLVI